MPVHARDELGELSLRFNDMLSKTRSATEAYNAMRTQLSELISQVSANAGSVSAASQQMASTSNEGGRAVSEIASSAADLAGTAEQLGALVARFQLELK